MILRNDDGTLKRFDEGGGASSNAALGQGYAVCDTAESTTSKTATINGYQLKDGGIVAIKFTNAVPANATLNINSKGAKAIYYNDSAIESGKINAGETVSFMYDGTYYRIISIAGSSYSPVIPDGETVTPTDDIQTWLKCGGIVKNYTTLSEVLADTAILSYLISDKNAVDYMVRSTTWANAICADQNAMSYIGLNNYCANILLNDETWCEAICNSEYFESVLNVKVPAMTSDTEPSGEASASSVLNNDPSSFGAWKAFDGSDIGSWQTAWETPIGWIQYKFVNPTEVKKIAIVAPTVISSEYGILNGKIQGSNDGNNFTDLISIEINTNATMYFNVPVSQSSIYMYYRFLSTKANYVAGSRTIVSTLQFYGRQDV